MRERTRFHSSTEVRASSTCDAGPLWRRVTPLAARAKRRATPIRIKVDVAPHGHPETGSRYDSGSSGVEQRDAADEAGASDGASQLNAVLSRPLRGEVIMPTRALLLLVVAGCLLGGGCAARDDASLAANRETVIAVMKSLRPHMTRAEVEAVLARTGATRFRRQTHADSFVLLAQAGPVRVWQLGIAFKGDGLSAARVWTEDGPYHPAEVPPDIVGKRIQLDPPRPAMFRLRRLERVAVVAISDARDCSAGPRTWVGEPACYGTHASVQSRMNEHCPLGFKKQGTMWNWESRGACE